MPFTVIILPGLSFQFSGEEHAIKEEVTEKFLQNKESFTLFY